MIAPRFETRRIGSARIDDWEIDVRILERVSEGGTFHVLVQGAIGDAVPSLDDAVRAAERDVVGLAWRSDLGPCDGEIPCPICTAPTAVTERYPRSVCVACVLEAVDEEGHPVTFANVDMSGGFVARRSDGSAPPRPHVCVIRGVVCHADEARFGGIVVEAGLHNASR